MRDLVAQEALKVMARDASKCLRELVAQGEQLPYDVREAEAASPLPQYVPLTERFIRDHSQALSAMDSFGAACAAIESAELSSAYLESFGIGVPGRGAQARGARRSGLPVPAMGRLDRLLARSGSPRQRDRRARGRRRDSRRRDRGDHPASRPAHARHALELATATIVRADTVDVPPEARAARGLRDRGVGADLPRRDPRQRVRPGRRPEPGRRCPRGRGLPPADHHAAPLQGWRRRSRPLRLDPRRRAPLAPDRDRRRAPAAGRLPPRRDGALRPRRLLADPRLPLDTVRSPREERPGLSGALARAISRFEAGLERAVVIEALNDYLLALRFVLEGGGAGPARPADAGRRAVRRARASRRDEGGRRPGRSALERELWSGEPAPTGEGAATPAQTLPPSRT